MAGKVIIQSGKVLTDGGVVNTCDCCITECEYCKTLTTPATLALTFTDVLPSASCCTGRLSDAYDWGDYLGPDACIMYKWVEAPTGFEEMLLVQQEGSECQYDAAVAPTTGKIACYRTGYWLDEIPGGTWITDEDCVNDENRLATLDVAFFYGYAQIGGVGTGDMMVSLTCSFKTPDLVERWMQECIGNTIKYMFSAHKELPNDESTPFKVLCLTEWDGDNELDDDDCVGVAYGGAVNVVPSR